jgi:glycosidase
MCRTSAATLNGVAARIPYLQELGVRYLHLLPFLRARGENDGGFAVTSFDDVEPALGTNADLEALTTQLRAAGISLCSDFILNHVADDHAWARRQGRRCTARDVPHLPGPQPCRTATSHAGAGVPAGRR